MPVLIDRDIGDSATVTALAQAQAEAESLRVLLENTSDVVLRLSIQGIVEWVSPSALLVLGWKPTRIVGRHLEGLVHRDDVSLVRETHEAVNAGHESELRFRALTARGDYAWVWSRSRPINGADGRPVAQVSSWRPIDDLVAAEQALHLSEARYRTLSENSSAIVAMCDRAGRLTWISDTVTEVLGWLPSDLVGHPFVDLVAANDCDLAEMLMRADADAPPNTQRVVRFNGVAGRQRWMSVHSRTVDVDVDSDGGMVIGLHDVSELMEARQHTDAIHDTMLDPLVVLHAIRDSAGAVVDFEYTDANQAACAYHQKTHDDLIGSRLLAVLPGEEGLEILHQCVDVVETGIPLSLDDVLHRQLLHGGGWRRRDVRVSKLDDGVLYTWRDVTDRYETMAALAQARERYRLLAENASDVAFRIARDGVIEWVTEGLEALLGWHPTACEGRHAVDFCHPDDQQEAMEAIAKAGSGEPTRLRIRLRTASGGWRWAESMLKPVLDDAGHVVGIMGGWRDVEAEQEATEALRASEENFRTLAEGASDVVMRVRSGVIEWISPSLQRTLGWTPEQWLNTAVEDHVHPEDVQALHDAYRHMSSGVSVRSRHRVMARDGVYHWVEEHGVGLTNSTAGGYLILTAFHLVDAEVAALRALERQARHDELTGLVNRATVIERLAAIMGHPPRTGQRTALGFCDIDDFKSVNDRYGHAAGDEALRVISHRLRQLVRDDDVVARFGGDEILVVLDRVHDLSDAVDLAETFRAAAKVPIPIGDTSIDVTISVGVTLAGDHEPVDALIARADAAMYEAKSEGKDRVVAFVEPLADNVF